MASRLPRIVVVCAGPGGAAVTICKTLSDPHRRLQSRLLTGFGTPRSLADARIAVIWLRYPIDDQNILLLGCLVVIDTLLGNGSLSPKSNQLLLATGQSTCRCQRRHDGRWRRQPFLDVLGPT